MKVEWSSSQSCDGVEPEKQRKTEEKNKINYIFSSQDQYGRKKRKRSHLNKDLRVNNLFLASGLVKFDNIRLSFDCLSLCWVTMFYAFVMRKNGE